MSRTLQRSPVTILTAIDLFSGAGGSTEGLRQAGYRVLAAVEVDSRAAATYRSNHPDIGLMENDIRSIDPGELLGRLGLVPGQLTLLNACPPCQGWSTLGPGDPNDTRNELIDTVIPFVKAFLPRSLLLENVPGIRRDPRFAGFMKAGTALGYKMKALVVDAVAFGVPQRRRRLIVIGARGVDGRRMPRALPGKWLLKRKPKPVSRAFAKLSEVPPNDPQNVPRQPRGKVLQRIAAIPVGGNRFDLPDHLVLNCHRTVGRQAGGPYGRVRISEPAPTMTSRCTSPSCGSFVHPEENRGLTLREAALIQTFPPSYVFCGTHSSIENQIGNAVPVTMAKQLAGIVSDLLGTAAD